MRIYLWILGFLAACSSSQFGGNAPTTRSEHQTTGLGTGTPAGTPNEVPGPSGPNAPSLNNPNVPANANTTSITVPVNSQVPIPVASSAAAAPSGTPSAIPPGTTCQSLNPNIATVNAATCVVTGISPGTAQIEIRPPDGPPHTVDVTVVPSTDSTAVSGAEPSASLSSSDAAVVASIPGVPVVQVGVNFEDSDVHKNFDWNDAVLCFNGNFKLDGTNVTSIADQTVTATTSSISGCSHRIRISIVHADGTAEPDQRVNSKTGNIANMTFKVGDTLQVFMTSTSGSSHCHVGTEVSMHGTDFGRPDAKVNGTCNTTGH